MIFFKLLFIFFFCYLITNAYGNKCFLPERCNLKTMFINAVDGTSNERGEFKVLATMCEINDEAYEFNFKETLLFNVVKKCPNNGMNYIILRWTNGLSILDNRFNFSNLIRYNRYYDYLNVKIWNLKGFDFNILNDLEAKKFNSSFYQLFSLAFSNCRFEFYQNKRKVNSCKDIMESNTTKIFSIFQIKIIQSLSLKNVEYNEKICPLIFVNSTIYNLVIIDIIDSFYKKSVLSISNETYTELNAKITNLEFHNVQNINLDLNILNPFVFYNTTFITIQSGWLNSIDGEIFQHLKNLAELWIDNVIFRKINHKQGIEWIKQWNNDVNVNIHNISNGCMEFKVLRMGSDRSSHIQPTWKLFPDEDFCLYRDFPFNQCVAIYETQYSDFSCTYLWLIQYYKSYYENYQRNQNNRYYTTYFYYFPNAVVNLIEETSALGLISQCNFEKRLSKCNKSNYQIKDFWDETDFFILNKKIQIAFKISIYPISILGLITNCIVVLVILKKENSDLFKDIKQYDYLYLNSIFCMMIFVIELLSWMTECFYPFEVFCPEIRKLVAIQFFKIIFTECFVTMFKFMCNFTYVAFALNRISLIGKDHGKLVTFISKIGIKKYIGVTLFVSSLLSWVKGLTYEINYFYPDPNFPLSIDLDSFENGISLSRFKDFIMVSNSISDLVNYLAFVVICIVIDICMVVQLRRVLEEKVKKTESLDQKQNERKKAESEEIVNKAIKMVVLNSVIGVLFKLPICIIPILNAYARFYYKDVLYNKYHPRFREFYSMFVNTGFYDLIRDVSHLLFILSLAIQMFIYKRFDKKFRTGYVRLMNKHSKKDKSEN